MSSKKKAPVTPSNTLFNYFKPSKTPQCPTSSDKQPTSKSSSESVAVRERENESPNRKKTDEPAKKIAKLDKKKSPSNRTPVRRKLIKSDSADEEEEDDPADQVLSPDGTEDEYQPSSDGESSDSSAAADDVSESSPSEDKNSDATPEKNPKKRSAKTLNSRKVKRPKLSLSPPKKKVASMPSSASVGVPASAVENDDDSKWPHQTYAFLKEDKIKDSSGRLKSHPDYDCRTLYVPDDFKKSLSSFMLQWWQFKEKYFDCVLFMKTGKFYELYHMDAIIGAHVLNCSMMGDQRDTTRVAHSGFPEHSYAKYAKKLVEEGYKVARIEQLETADDMNARLKNKVPGKAADKSCKTLQRAVCKITCEGAETFSTIDVYENGGDSSKAIDFGYEENKFLLAIKKKDNTFGVTFVDTTIGEFHTGCFVDDTKFSRLTTLMAHYPPCRVLLEKHQWSKAEINNLFPKVTIDYLTEKEFLAESKLIEEQVKDFGEQKFFPIEGDSTVDRHNLGISSFGAIYFFLKRCLIHHQLITLAKFTQYTPVDLLYNSESESDSDSQQDRRIRAKYMVLDSTALTALNVLKNSSNTLEGTLIEKLNHCVTSFGKRMLRAQLVKPLTNISDIQKRQKAVSVFLKNNEVIGKIRTGLSDIPDLERMFIRIHAMTSRAYSKTHPNIKACYSEDLQKAFSKKNIEEFTRALNGFEKAQTLIESLQDSQIIEESELLATLCSLNNGPSTENSSSGSDDGRGSQFPDLTQILKFFKNAFDHKVALKEGRVIPHSRGVDDEYDAIEDEIQRLDMELQKHLKDCIRHFGCKIVFSQGLKFKTKYYLEVPIASSKNVKPPMTIVAQKNKSTCLVSTEEGQKLSAAMADVLARKKHLLEDISDKIFIKFGDHIQEWSRAIYCLAMLDFLTSIAQYCLKAESGVCVPTFRDPNETEPFISANEGLFPCSTGDQSYVPNNTVVGRKKNERDTNTSVLFLTGPNMGGKSTVMRQVGLMTIMAQIGCHVPAQEFELTPVDRIFTRIGGSDNIIAGQSTFFNELLEASCTMRHATNHSLVLVDELGRGTSTYDGTVIAAAVLQKLIDIGCLTVFSTHYHSLAKDFAKHPAIVFEYLDYMFEDSSSPGGLGELIFFYKLAPGVCSRSFGFNAAKLADLPLSIIQNGSKISARMEERYKKHYMFTQLIGTNCARVTDCLQLLAN